MMRKIYSFDNRLFLATGAHKVLVDIHNAIKNDFDAKIIGISDFEQLNPSLKINEQEYLRLRNPFMLRNSILFVHQRRLAIIFQLLNVFLFLNLEVIYVHHSILKGNRKTTFFPKHVVTISDRCINNLIDYFKVPVGHIIKIHNTVPDLFKKSHKKSNDGRIRILYPATVYPLKRQIQVYTNLKDSLPNDVEIIYAGNGPDYQELVSLTKDDSRFICLGFIDNVKDKLSEVDYCMLFSEYEGLPISLIEATMMGVPIICNDVGGNLEIAVDGYNAFVCNTWEELSDCLIKLKNVSDEEYNRMSSDSRTQYLKNFTFEIFKTKYVNYLKEIEDGKN